MQYDVIIVGGGMVGLALAGLLIQKTSLSIAILEAQAHVPEWDSNSNYPRVSAIALSSQRVFQSLQVWDSMQKKRVSPFAKIGVWDAASKAEITFDSKEIAEPLLGYIIENNLIQSELLLKIKKSTQVTFLSPVKLAQLIEKEKSIELQTVEGQVFQAKLVIGADGANSWLRQQAGIEVVQHNYDQSAIIATVHTALPHHSVAQQVFFKSGSLAFLPLLKEKTSSIAWSLPTQEAKHLIAMDTDSFKQQLVQTFEYRLGDILEVEQRYSFTLIKQHAKRYIGSRIALIGDAAHTIHPLAGQGVNMGLLDALSLANIMIDAVKQNKDIANYTSLRRYERERKAENATMLVGVDLIKWMLASEKKSIQTIRAIGLSTVDRIAVLKNIFTRYAVGV
jgi:2-octaprenylphenol hydroxylase